MAIRNVERLHTVENAVAASMSAASRSTGLVWVFNFDLAHAVAFLIGSCDPVFFDPVSIGGDEAARATSSTIAVRLILMGVWRDSSQP